MAPNIPQDIMRKLDRLAKTTAALRDGIEKHFEATRLTTLKSLCQEREVAMRFGLYLAEKAYAQMQDKSGYRSLDDDEWERYKALAVKAIEAMQTYLDRPTPTHGSAVSKCLWQVREAQNETRRPMNKYTVRIIHSKQLLVIEYALQCFTMPEPGYWAYQTARHYADRYDSRYGAGLIPESVPLLEDILGFWMG